MSEPDNRLVWVLAKLTHEMAIQLDTNHEDANDLATMALDDSACLSFRRAIDVLRSVGAPVTSTVRGVEARMQAAYLEAFEKPLPPLDEVDDELPVTADMWAGRAGA